VRGSRVSSVLCRRALGSAKPKSLGDGADVVRVARTKRGNSNCVLGLRRSRRWFLDLLAAVRGDAEKTTTPEPVGGGLPWRLARDFLRAGAERSVRSGVRRGGRGCGRPGRKRSGDAAARKVTREHRAGGSRVSSVLRRRVLGSAKPTSLGDGACFAVLDLAPQLALGLRDLA